MSFALELDPPVKGNHAGRAVASESNPDRPRTSLELVYLPASECRLRRAFSCCGASSRRANDRFRPASAARHRPAPWNYPTQGVVESRATRSERTPLQRSVIHGIQTGGTQRLGVGVAIAGLPNDDRMADSANRADLALFSGDQIATPEAPFSDVAVLADTRPDLPDGGIDDNRHRQTRIVGIGIEQGRGYRRAKAPCRPRWKFASFGEHLHVVQPFGDACAPGFLIPPARSVIREHRIIPQHRISQPRGGGSESFGREAFRGPGCITCPFEAAGHRCSCTASDPPTPHLRSIAPYQDHHHPADTAILPFG
jgi:hypothetical protein